MCSQIDYNSYGIDWEGPIPEADTDLVKVPKTECPFTDEQLRQLQGSEKINYIWLEYGCIAKLLVFCRYMTVIP